MGRAATIVGGLWVFFAYCWMPTWGLWQVHFAALETLLGAAVLGLAGIALGRSRPWKAAAAAVAALAALPLVAAIPMLADFSLREYVLGVRGAEVVVERGVRLEPSRADLLADVYHAPGDGPHPFVVVIHGGSWRHGARGENEHVSRELAAAGYTVVDIDYRLAPTHPFPAGIADAKCLVGRLREQAERWRIDPRRGAYLGRSAGGHMATLLAYSAGDPRLPPGCDVDDTAIQAVIAVYAVMDLAYAHDHPVRPDVVDGPESLRLYLGGTPAQAPAAYELASPVARARTTRGLPPTLLVHGGLDRLVEPRHSVVLADALRAGGSPGALVLIPLAEHGFDHRPGGIADQVTRDAALDFLRQHL